MTEMAVRRGRARGVASLPSAATVNDVATMQSPRVSRVSSPAPLAVASRWSAPSTIPVTAPAALRADIQPTVGVGQDASRWRERWYPAHAKRVVDVALASFLLILLLPVLLGAVTWIVLDARANPFFAQRRIGRDGVAFRLFKLRTMEPSGAEGLLFLVDEHGVRRHKIRNDPRVTRPGRFLRRTSIDELPQLWNVLRGEMSLVGPRPELPEIVAGYDEWQHARHAVRPGLTGWWQVSGRSDAPMHEHTELDIYYVERLSPRLDALIARRTVRVVLKGLGAF